MKKFVLGISSVVSFLLFLIMVIVMNGMAGTLEEQNMAGKWSRNQSTAHVSCFFSVNSGIDIERIQEFEHSIDGALQNASVENQSDNPSARLWVDAYSAKGMINISSNRSALTAEAIGIGGDFFLFHPLKLLSGSYFSGNDVLTDYCVIDQDAAWQLFGSNNVVGQVVYIGGIPHIITGVVERPQGRMIKEAGLKSTIVYVSYSTLSNLGTNQGINHYEVLMPNPVSKFAYDYVKEQLGGNEETTEIIENNTRFSLLARIKLISQLGTRSMNGKAIIYPYWENLARGYEDIFALFTFLELLFLVISIVSAVLFVRKLWKHKGWTVREKLYMVRDRLERKRELTRKTKVNRLKNGGDLL